MAISYNGHHCPTNDYKDKVVKFNYLISFLEGPALDLVKGYSITSGNYDAAVDELEETFGRPDATKESHFQALNHLPAVTDQNDVSGLRRLYDKANASMRSLTGLGVDEYSYRYTVKPMILGKLPHVLTVEWYRKKDHYSQSLPQLMTFFKEELKGREDAALLRKHLGKPQQQQQQQQQKKSSNNQSKKEVESPVKSTAMALAANAAGPTQVEGSKNNGSSSGNNRDKS